MPLLPRGCGGLDGEVAQHCSQHHIHLHIGKHRSHAASDATAERNPGIRSRLVLKEALGTEKRLGQLAQSFQVSKEAMRIKLDEQGLLLRLTSFD